MRALWPTLGLYLRDVAEIWDEWLVIPRQSALRTMYPLPGRRHVLYRLKYMKYRILRRQKRFGVLALIY